MSVVAGVIAGRKHSPRPRGGVLPTAAWEQVFNRAVALGAEGLYDVTNPNTRTVSNGTVSQIQDAMGNLLPLAQATTAAQPTHSAAAVGDFDALVFDGTDDKMSTAAFSAALTQAVTVAVLTKQDVQKYGIVLGPGDSGDGLWVYHDWRADEDRDYALYAGTDVFESNAGADTAWHVLLVEFNGVSSNMWVDDTLVFDGVDPGTDAMASLGIGAEVGDGGFLEGQIGPIMIIDGLLSSSDRQALIDLLHELSGIAKAGGAPDVPQNLAATAVSSSQIDLTWDGVADTEAPTVPQNLVATAVSSSQIDLTWDASTDNVGVDHYNVYRDGGATPIAQPTSNSYSDTGRAASTSYSYEVSAVDAAGNESAKSASDSATTEAVSEEFALSFDGTTDGYVALGRDDTRYEGIPEITVGTWVSLAGTGSNQSILEFSGSTSDRNWGLRFVTGGNPGFSFLISDATTEQSIVHNAPISVDTLYFVCARYTQGGNLQITVDADHASVAASVTLSYKSKDLHYGALSGGSFTQLTGVMFEPFIYDRALSDAEVDSIRNGTFTQTNLVSHWLTNEGSGSVLANAISGANDGTLQAGVTWVPRPTS